MADRRRRKSKAKKNQHRPPPGNTELLSADVLSSHILARLPLDSLRSFRFLSKQCYSYITTPLFAKKQLHHQNQNQNHHKLLDLSDTSFRSIGPENPDKYIVRPINNPVTNEYIFSDSEPFPFKVADHYDLSAVTSFHGMVCIALKHSDDKYSDNLIIWNPLIGEYKTLSKTGSHKECYDIYGGLFQLYYSSSEDDYKLLRIIPHYSHVCIYSLKSDSWRNVELTEVDIRPVYFYRHGWIPCMSALLNEKIYFVNQQNSYSVISFDTKTEKFTKIATPYLAKLSDYCLSNVFVLRGCIHLYCGNIAPAGLWRMEGDGDWTKVELAFPWFLQPWQLMRIKDRLRHSESGDALVSPNRHASLEESLSTLDMKEHRRRSWYIVEYMETIVSPNQYTK